MTRTPRPDEETQRVPDALRAEITALVLEVIAEKVRAGDLVLVRPDAGETRSLRTATARGA